MGGLITSQSWSCHMSRHAVISFGAGTISSRGSCDRAWFSQSHDLRNSAVLANYAAALPLLWRRLSILKVLVLDRISTVPASVTPLHSLSPSFVNASAQRPRKNLSATYWPRTRTCVKAVCEAFTFISATRRLLSTKDRLANPATERRLNHAHQMCSRSVPSSAQESGMPPPTPRMPIYGRMRLK